MFEKRHFKNLGIGRIRKNRILRLTSRIFMDRKWIEPFQGHVKFEALVSVGLNLLGLYYEYLRSYTERKYWGNLCINTETLI